MEKSVNFLSIVAKIKWSPSTSRKSTKILANRPFWLKIWIRSRGKNHTFLNPVNSWNSTLDFNGNSTGILRIRKIEKKPKKSPSFFKVVYLWWGWSISTHFVGKIPSDISISTCFCVPFSVEITSNGKWLAIGIQSQIWILSLEWNNFQITQIEHFATFEGHREPVSNLHFVDCPGFDTRLISTSHDRTFNIWSVHKLECMYESPLLGHYRWGSRWKLCFYWNDLSFIC